MKRNQRNETEITKLKINKDYIKEKKDSFK